MKKVVLMTDFSMNARNAIKYGINLFGDSVEYVLVSTYTVRRTAGSIGNISKIIKERTKADLEQELIYINDEFSKLIDLKISTLCKNISPEDFAKNIGEKDEADLIVLGTKGASGLGKVFFGSVTASIIRNTKLPVLSVPEETEFNGLHRIVFAADLSKNKNNELTVPLKDIALQSKADVFLLHVLKEGDSSPKSGQDRLEEIKSAFDFKGVNLSMDDLEGEDTIKEIKEYCLKRDANLLAVIARHNSFWDNFLYTSISQELVFSLKIPLLTLEDSF